MRLEGFSWRRTVVIFIIAIALGVLLVAQALVPAKKWLGARFEVRGDNYMVNEEFIRAEAEYLRAVEFTPENSQVQQKLQWSRIGRTDIAQLREFYQAKNQEEVVRKISQATADYSHPKEALEVALEFYRVGNFSYARYPAELATRLDSQYPEAWHYVGLIYDELANYDSQFSGKADQARQKRDALTPNYLELE